MLDALAAAALETVASKRAVFGEANVLAEVHRQLHGAHFATAFDRLSVVGQITHRALQRRACPSTILLGNPVGHGAAAPWCRPLHDRHDPRRRNAPARAGRDLDAPVVDDFALSDLSPTTTAVGPRSARSDHLDRYVRPRLDLLVGPAGAGKTTTLAALKTAWEREHGPGSVIGLAPSAAAAQVLADELGIACENTAKWLVEQDRNRERDDRIAALEREIAATCSSPSTALARDLRAKCNAIEAEQQRWSIQPGQLVIIDEASLAGTLVLDAIATDARDMYAKVLLVGDWAQLGAIDAGGAFHMLATDRRRHPNALRRPSLRRRLGSRRLPPTPRRRHRRDRRLPRPRPRPHLRSTDASTPAPAPKPCTPCSRAGAPTSPTA